MKPILREAIRRVREGYDFGLLDALELLERRRNGEAGALAVVRYCGRTLIGYGDASDVASSSCECPACEGDGELEAEGANGQTYYVMCPACFGDGEIDTAKSGIQGMIPEWPEMAWRTLNGEPAEYEDSIHNAARPVDHYQAATLVHKAEQELEQVAEAA